jgi:hypothetical protein
MKAVADPKARAGHSRGWRQRPGEACSRLRGSFTREAMSSRTSRTRVIPSMPRSEGSSVVAWPRSRRVDLDGVFDQLAHQRGICDLPPFFAHTNTTVGLFGIGRLSMLHPGSDGTRGRRVPRSASLTSAQRRPAASSPRAASSIHVAR